ncbi:MAG: hypothetical protein AVDCRST_MAG25-368 [uncultured Rubrobacteraceae bacterium]|uniref:B3/B4 tRNA-binding domain-containing protein n=1 Tax=uncultured Rubrobacteraceae bacterium TaxID=349277 RepID=A0A6J4QXC0_9ACTN|nr:MAG: hypothetical protein AVDCRST_MAG25-368 [uncultured Rubrobacteraceae bacterium]
MFAYDAAVLARYPTIRAGVVHATGLTNGPSPPDLIDEYRAEQRAVAEGLRVTSPADLPSISAWRRAFTRFGAKPTQHRNAAEALLRRLARHGDIPTINILVDIGNLVSIRYAMPVAVFDLARISGSTTVRFATGTEVFTDLGSTAGVHPDPGEVVFVDRNEDVSARRWCWRQSARSATVAATVDALIVVEGHHEAASQDIASAIRDLTSLLDAYQPESHAEPYALSPSNPRAGTSEGDEEASR